MGSGVFWFLLSRLGHGKLSWGTGGKSWIGWGGPAPKQEGQKDILVLLLHELTDLRQGQDTYSEGGTHGETQRPQIKAKVGTRDEGTRSQLRQVADS